MKNIRKRKVIEVEPNKSYFYLDKETGEYVALQHKEIQIAGKINRHQIHFMKLYTQNGILPKIQQVAGSDSQYLLTLADCIIDEDNQFEIHKFQGLVNLSQTNFYGLLKRLREKGIISKINKRWHVNPFFLGFGNKISEDVFREFREKTSMLYGITEI